MVFPEPVREPRPSHPLFAAQLVEVEAPPDAAQSRRRSGTFGPGILELGSDFFMPVSWVPGKPARKIHRDFPGWPLSSHATHPREGEEACMQTKGSDVKSTDAPKDKEVRGE